MKQWNIVLDRIDRYDCSKQNVWAFRKSADERDGIRIALGNMCGGFDFSLGGLHFFGSEQAYICGLFSDGSPEHAAIQRELIAETNGYAAKKRIRRKYESLGRPDWESFNIEWMKYVVWNKVKWNSEFRRLLLSIPPDAHIVENSTFQRSATAAIWGAKNRELKAARDRAVKEESERLGRKLKAREEMLLRNSINGIGVFEGKNLTGKILKLCQLALLEGSEPDIDYGLLRSKKIHLGEREVDYTTQVQ